jgi:hypothetical protein
MLAAEPFRAFPDTLTLCLACRASLVAFSAQGMAVGYDLLYEQFENTTLRQAVEQAIVSRFERDAACAPR